MLNRATLVGHLGADPDIRRTQDGRPIVTFSLATSETWKDRATGEKKEATEWHRIVVFAEGLAGVAEKYLRKGSRVHVEGMIRTRKWQDQQGVDRYTTEIVLQGYGAVLLLLDRAERAPAPDEAAYGSRPAAAAAAGAEDRAAIERRAREQSDRMRTAAQTQAPADFDDEIPF